MALLIENGADVNATNQAGKSIMDYERRWHDEVIMELVERKFNFQAKEDEKLLVLQRRKNVLQLLDDWETASKRSRDGS